MKERTAGLQEFEMLEGQKGNVVGEVRRASETFTYSPAASHALTHTFQPNHTPSNQIDRKHTRTHLRTHKERVHLRTHARMRVHIHISMQLTFSIADESVKQFQGLVQKTQGAAELWGSETDGIFETKRHTRREKTLSDDLDLPLLAALCNADGKREAEQKEEGEGERKEETRTVTRREIWLGECRLFWTSCMRLCAMQTEDRGQWRRRMGWDLGLGGIGGKERKKWKCIREVDVAR